MENPAMNQTEKSKEHSLPNGDIQQDQPAGDKEFKSSENQVEVKQSGDQGEDIQSGDQQKVEQSGDQGEIKQSGDQGEIKQSGDQGENKQSGDQGEDIQPGDQQKVEPSGDQGEIKQSGDQGEPKQSGDHKVESSGDQGEATQSGDQQKFEPSGDQQKAEPLGDQGEPKQTGDQDKVEPSGDQGEATQSRDQQEVEPSGEQEEAKQPGDQGEVDPSGDQGDVKMSGYKVEAKPSEDQGKKEPDGDEKDVQPAVDEVQPVEAEANNEIDDVALDEEVEEAFETDNSCSSDNTNGTATGPISTMSGSTPTADSGVNSEQTADISADTNGHYLTPIGVSPSTTPNPDAIPINSKTQYVKHLVEACQTLHEVCECIVLTAPRTVSSFRHLVGPCPNLLDFTKIMSNAVLDLATFALRLMAGSMQMQTVLKNYRPTVSRIETCRDLMIDTLSRFIQCLLVVVIECEDLDAYYTYFKSTPEGGRYPSETHDVLLKQLKSSIVTLENQVDAVEEAQMKFENAYYCLQEHPSVCNNLGRGSFPPSKHYAPSSNPKKAAEEPQDNVFVRMRKGLCSFGRIITGSWRGKESKCNNKQG